MVGCVGYIDGNARVGIANFGSSVDVAAPGGDSSRDADGDGYVDGVLSTLGDDSSGTVEDPDKIVRMRVKADIEN